MHAKHMHCTSTSLERDTGRNRERPCRFGWGWRYFWGDGAFPQRTNHRGVWRVWWWWWPIAIGFRCDYWVLLLFWLLSVLEAELASTTVTIFPSSSSSWWWHCHSAPRCSSRTKNTSKRRNWLGELTSFGQFTFLIVKSFDFMYFIGPWLGGFKSATWLHPIRRGCMRYSCPNFLHQARVVEAPHPKGQGQGQGQGTGRYYLRE